MFSRSSDRLPKDYILSIFRQLNAAILYCHNGLTIGPSGSISGNSFDWKPILHRDIKHGNGKHYLTLRDSLRLYSTVMLSTNEETADVVVRLGDFGLSTFVDDGKAPSTYAGTKEYLAPVSAMSKKPHCIGY